MTIEQVLATLPENCWFLTDTDARIMITNGFGGLPVLIRRGCSREVVRLRNLADAMAVPREEYDYLRDVSTWPEYVQAVLNGVTEPSHPNLPKN